MRAEPSLTLQKFGTGRAIQRSQGALTVLDHVVGVADRLETVTGRGCRPALATVETVAGEITLSLGLHARRSRPWPAIGQEQAASSTARVMTLS